MGVENGDTVKVDYTGTYDDGTVFDTSKDHGPLEFTVGSNQVVGGFERAVLGMGIGEKKKVRLEPKDAYGEHNPTLVFEIPRDKLPKLDFKEGKTFYFSMQGMQVPARVTELKDESVTLDLNSPMAGKTLNFEIQVVAITR